MIELLQCPPPQILRPGRSDGFAHGVILHLYPGAAITEVIGTQAIHLLAIKEVELGRVPSDFDFDRQGLLSSPSLMVALGLC